MKTDHIYQRKTKQQYSTKNGKQKRTVTETTKNKFTFIRIKQGDKKKEKKIVTQIRSTAAHSTGDYNLVF